MQDFLSISEVTLFFPERDQEWEWAKSFKNWVPGSLPAQAKKG